MSISEYDILKEENVGLKKLIREMEEEKEAEWSVKIDKHVDEWFEKYKDEVDIGRLSVFEFMGSKYEIDLLPDEMEKAIYKKCIKIVLSMLSEFKLK